MNRSFGNRCFDSSESISLSKRLSLAVLGLVFVSFGTLYSQELPTGVIGGVVAVSLPENAKSASFNERVQLIINNNAIVGIPLDTEPATLELVVILNDDTTVKLPFLAITKEYEEQHITIENQEQVTPPPDYYERLAREAELMSEAYAVRSSIREDLLPIIQPTDGIRTGVFGTKRFFNGEPRNPHSGVDYAADTGTPIQAPAPGTVILTENMFFNGNTVVIDHGMGLVSVLCHMDSITVEMNDDVERGETVGTVGSTGRATGPHLHWTTALQGVKVDPEVFMTVVNEIYEKSNNDDG